MKNKFFFGGVGLVLITMTIILINLSKTDYQGSINWFQGNLSEAQELLNDNQIIMLEFYIDN